VIYQLLTGHLPFNASTGVAMAHQILNVDPDLPSVSRPEIPARIDDVIMTALRKEPGARFATWEEYAQQLAGVVGNLGRADDTLADAEKFSTMRRLDFFNRFTDVDLWQVLRIAEWEKFEAADVIIREGDVGTAFFVLVSGEVKVSKQGKILNILKAGECFGEMSYIGSRKLPRTASVTAANAVTTVKVGPDALSHTTESCAHAFDSAFLELLVSRLEAANTRLSSLLLDRRISMF
jgi:hypothetical protein